MAAIDKLYVHTFQEYEEVKLWAMVYYPKLLLWFYNISLTYQQYRLNRQDWLMKTREVSVTIDYDREQLIVADKLDNEEPEDTYMFPIMNTPCKIDRKLKWICPVPCVREYLHKQCGVNPKWEWLYKIFWRGKKHF